MPTLRIPSLQPPGLPYASVNSIRSFHHDTGKVPLVLAFFDALTFVVLFLSPTYAYYKLGISTV